MQDLLHGFTDPNVMDIKMGTRTFLESEVTNLTARPDLYEKVSLGNEHLQRIFVCLLVSFFFFYHLIFLNFKLHSSVQFHSVFSIVPSTKQFFCETLDGES